MDLANILLFCLMSLIIGAVLMLLIQYYAFVRYFKLPDDDADSSANGGVGNEDNQTRLNEKFALPDVSDCNILVSCFFFIILLKILSNMETLVYRNGYQNLHNLLGYTSK